MRRAPSSSLPRSAAVWLSLAAATACCGLLAVPPAKAQPTTQEGASILFFPNLAESQGFIDTRIFIANVANSLVKARCFYIGDEVTSFDLTLTRQQPTQWILSQGRAVNPLDPVCESDVLNCDTAGFDPGGIPPMSEGYTLQMVCVEVDVSGAPLGGNHLIGHASVQDLLTGQTTTYGAVGLRGNDLAGSTGNLLEIGPQYDGCAESYSLQHRPIAGAGEVGVSTHIMVLPCTLDLTQPSPYRAPLKVEIVTTTEFETKLSSSILVSQPGGFQLDPMLPTAFEGQTARVEMRSIEIMPGANVHGMVPVAQFGYDLGFDFVLEAQAGASLDTGRSRYDLLLVDQIDLPDPVLP